MWTDDYFDKVKKFRKDIAEFEGVLYDMPDEICEHTNELQYAIQDFRVALRKYTDFISMIHEIDKLYSDKDEGGKMIDTVTKMKEQLDRFGGIE